MTTSVGDIWDELVRELQASKGEPTLALCSKAARKVAAAIRECSLPSGVQRIRIAVLRSFTAEPLVSPLITFLALHGYAAEVEIGRMGSIADDILSENSFLRASFFDLIVVISHADAVWPGAFDPSIDVSNAEAGSHYLKLLSSLAQSAAGQVVACNLPLPDRLLAHNCAVQTPSSGRYLLPALNREMVRVASCHRNLVVCDIEHLANFIGLEGFYSPRDMAAYMQPFTSRAITSIARELSEMCALALSGPAIKCLILDCDNTLWGGVSGEDGIDNLRLGDGYPGICYQEFQRQLLQLRHLGYLLGISSKNDEALVRAVFERHPGMVLKWSDFAAVRVNWDAKAQNLAAIASQLRLGLDSFAFFDDSDYELDSVRRCLPQVRCLKVPGEAWQIPMVIPASRLFDKLSVTDEDRHRSETYTSARLRTELESTAESHDAFLRQLEMVVTIERFDAGLHLRRAAQLTQRTNQFNLTTRRHSEAELSSAIEQGALVFMGSLRDRFGDYGRVLLAVLQPIDDRILRLDTFLMSCRAIGRNVEIVWMRALLQSVKRQGWGELRAEYIPTAKNGVCENFLTVCGFLPVEGGSGAARQYWLDLSQPITVEDQTIELETIV